LPATIDVPHLEAKKSVTVKDIIAMTAERAPVDRDSGGGKEAVEGARHSSRGGKK